MVEEMHVTDKGMISSANGEQNCSMSRSTWKKGKVCFFLCEVLILTPVMLTIVGLFCIPTVLYAFSKAESKVVQDIANNIDTCSQVDIYSGSICKEVFTSLQTCFSGVTSPPPPLNIPSLIDQQAGERGAMRLVNGLSLLSPSPQCREAILPFLCLSIFTLCDSSNRSHTILREDCLELRDDICAEEWGQAVGFLGAGVLPVCEDLADYAEECIESNILAEGMNLTNHYETTTSFTTDQIISEDQLITCSKGLFFDRNVTNMCRPICGEFQQTRFGVQVLENVAICVCFIASVVMFVLALTVQRESLLLFPLNLLVYLCGTTFILSGVAIVGLFDNDALFCGSKDLIETLLKGNETVFCIISGFVFTYSLQQVCIWGGLHAGFLFWGMRYPFNYRMFKLSGRIRYAHISSVILAVVVPLPAALVHLKGGYVITASPTLVCAGRNTDYNYYTFILPLSIILTITMCLLVLIFWTVLKEFVLKKLLARKKMGNVGTAQLKITAILIYYTALGVMGLTTSTKSFASYAARTMDMENFVQYLSCENSGGSDCVFDSALLNSVRTLYIVVVVLVSFLPVVAILFSCDPRVCKRKPAKVEALSKKSSVLSGL